MKLKFMTTKNKRKKFLLPVAIAVALVVGFGSVFVAKTIMNDDASVANTAGEKYGQPHTDGEKPHGDTSSHSGGATGNITADASIKSVEPDQTIGLYSDRADPGEVYLKVGQVLQFNTKDGKTHRIALGEGGTDHEHLSSTNSGNFGADEGWRVRFDNVGTFYFHDHLNPNINVLVVVYKPSIK